jgi:hypothetical protein
MERNLLQRFIILLIVWGFISVETVYAQDSNPWLSQVGNTSALLGGAAVNGTFDNSGIYYNPGSLAFVENTGISLSGNAFYFNVYNIINGAGNGLDLKTTGLTGAPSLISGVIKNKKNPNFSVTYAIINLDLKTTLFSVQNSINYDVIESLPGDEHYIGIYKYQNRKREDWVGFGLGRKYFDSKFGVGISQFVAIKTQNYLNNHSAQVFSNTTNLSDPIGTHTYYEDFSFSNIALVWKIGVNYMIERFRIGLTITTPKANIPMLNGRLIRNEYIDIPTQGELSYQATYLEKIKTVHKTPWNFDMGASFIRDKHSIYLRVLATSRVGSYKMLKPGTGKEEFINLEADDDAPFKTMQSALRPIVNVSMGYTRKITDSFSFLGGIRTDFNAYDEKRLPRQYNYVPSIGYLNLYHLSAGTLWYEEKYRLTVGFTYSLGYSREDLQQINLTSPSDETSLFGVQNNSTKTRFNQIGFHFGFTYLFSRIQD